MKEKYFKWILMSSFAFILLSFLLTAGGLSRTGNEKEKFIKLKSNRLIKTMKAQITKNNKVKVDMSGVKRALLKAGIKSNPEIRLKSKGILLSTFRRSDNFVKFPKSKITLSKKVECSLVFSFEGEILVVMPVDIVLYDLTQYGGKLKISHITVHFVPSGSYERLAIDFHIHNVGSGICGTSDSGSYPFLHIHELHYSTVYGDFIFENPEQWTPIRSGPYSKTAFQYPNGRITEIENLEPGNYYVLRYFPTQGYCSKPTCKPKGADGVVTADIRYRESPSGEYKLSPRKTKEFNFNL